MRKKKSPQIRKKSKQVSITVQKDKMISHDSGGNTLPYNPQNPYFNNTAYTPVFGNGIPNE